MDDSIAHGAHIAAVLNTLDIPEDAPEAPEDGEEAQHEQAR